MSTPGVKCVMQLSVSFFPPHDPTIHGNGNIIHLQQHVGIQTCPVIKKKETYHIQQTNGPGEPIGSCSQPNPQQSEYGTYQLQQPYRVPPQGKQWMEEKFSVHGPNNATFRLKNRHFSRKFSLFIMPLLLARILVRFL